MGPIDQFPPQIGGNALDRFEKGVRLGLWAVGTAAGVGLEIARRVIGRCRGRRQAPAPQWPGQVSGEELEALLRLAGYAPATARRYRQTVRRFTAWFLAGGDLGEDEGAVSRYLAERLAAAGPAAGPALRGRQDPRHLGLSRTTVCAVRTGVDWLFGRRLTADAALPPRPRRLRAAGAATVAALCRAAAGRREQLLPLLSCGVLLRSGQMAGLRGRDVDRRRWQVSYEGRQGRREAPVPPGCRRILARCLRGCAPDEFLFPSPARGGKGHLSVRALETAFRRLAQRAGAPPGTTLETLRAAGAAGVSPWGDGVPAGGRAEAAPARRRGAAGRRRPAGGTPAARGSRKVGPRPPRRRTEPLPRRGRQAPAAMPLGP